MLPNSSESLHHVPQWAREAIWYQIFVERFRNGDPSNDPTPEDMTGSDPNVIPPNWAVTPWGHDWYRPDPWLDDVPVKGFHYKVQLRRYGGDLQGVLDRLDYIQSLGVTALYFNPLNDSPSLHKYDARSYHHIDRNFGPDPKGDAAIMAAETPGDPSTWQWTSADRLFLRLVDECHRRGLRVIVDFSWNHTGGQFWAVHDLKAKGLRSAYRDWYNLTSTRPGRIQLEGWANNLHMPVVRKQIDGPADRMPFEGNLYAASLREHIFAVTARWLDPDGDGDPRDGIDGFRLDVAAEVPMGFWRDYRRFVRSINPEAYLVGEVWWEEWPDRLMDPRPFLQGDQLDAVMNYRWYRLARGFFGQCEPRLTPSAFTAAIGDINRGIRPEVLQAMMNVAASHDSPRLATSLFNKTKYKFQAKPSDNPDYKIHRPDERTRREQRLLLLHQFTFPGAPHIWNGDEVGMWGADDPDCRKPMLWDDLTYEPESAHLLPGHERPVDPVAPDNGLRAFYTQLAHFRRRHPMLAYADLAFTLADDLQMTLAYSRVLEEEEIVAAFNRSDAPKELRVPVRLGGTYRRALPDGRRFVTRNKILCLKLSPLEGVVLVRESGKRWSLFAVCRSLFARRSTNCSLPHVN